MLRSGIMSDTGAPAEGHKFLNDRRSEPRVPAAGMGKLTVISPRSLENLAADVLDVSRWGLQLEVDECIESGSSIELQLRTMTVWGEVAHFRPIGSGRYRVGVSTGWLTDLRQQE